jgi:hypothetical protein
MSCLVRYRGQINNRKSWSIRYRLATLIMAPVYNVIICRPSAGKREEAMKTNFKVAIALVAGAAMGGVAI